MRYIATDDLRRLNAERGGHWFEPSTMRFFRSRVGHLAYGDDEQRFAFFVSSEQFVSVSSGHAGPRSYSVRVMHLTDGDGPRTMRGQVETVGDFEAYATRAAAERIARALAADPSDYIAGLAIDSTREAAQA